MRFPIKSAISRGKQFSFILISLKYALMYFIAFKLAILFDFVSLFLEIINNNYYY